MQDQLILNPNNYPMKYRITIFLLIFIHYSAFSQLVINEFSAANQSHFTDNYGDTPDWIEIYNSSTQDINLSGYYLSDKLSEPLKWQIPGGLVPAEGYLLIFATGRDEFFGGFLHANFKISQTQEEDIILTGPDEVTIDWYHIAEANKVDQSRGRISDGNASWGVFTSPTPGASNINAFSDYAAKPILSVDAGFYTGSVSVSVNQNGAGLTTYYTTDGSVPTNTSTEYSAAIDISSTTVL